MDGMFCRHHGLQHGQNALPLGSLTVYLHGFQIATSLHFLLLLNLLQKEEDKCDMIRRNESDVGDVVYEIFA